MSSEPGQDLETDALGILFGSNRDGNRDTAQVAVPDDGNDGQWEWDNITRLDPSLNGEVGQGDGEVDKSNVCHLIIYLVSF